MTQSKNLEISYSYANGGLVAAEILKPTDAPLVIGAESLAAIFGVASSDLSNISDPHLTIWFDSADENFHFRDTSTNGTFVRMIRDEPNSRSRERRLWNKSDQLKNHVRLRLRNQDHHGNSCDIIVELQNENYEGTKAVTTFLPWNNLLEKLSQNRAVHLTGMSGVGKSYLVQRLQEAEGTHWQRTRDSKLSHNQKRVLPIVVDGDDIKATADNPLWRSLARQILFEMVTATDQARMYDVCDKIDDIANDEFDLRVTKRPSQSRRLLERAVRLLVEDEQCVLLFIFEDFDAVLEHTVAGMLDLLARTQEIKSFRENLYYVLVTQRSLRHIQNARDDTENFSLLFANYLEQLVCVEMGRFGRLWSEISHGQILPLKVETDLYALSGGHPGILKDIYDHLHFANIFDEPAKWQHHLASYQWVLEDSPASQSIWTMLTREERASLYGLAKGRATWIEPTLGEYGILDEQHTIFSTLFAQLIPALHQWEIEQAPNLALTREHGDGAITAYCKAQNEHGEYEIKKVDLTGSQLMALAYLYDHRHRVCRIEELSRCIYQLDKRIKADVLRSYGSNTQKHITRLRERIDPNTVYIQTYEGIGYRLHYR